MMMTARPSPFLAREAAQQFQHLRLHCHVERRSRLVGDQQVRLAAPAPWRSSRAGAGRRKVRADSDREPGARVAARPGEEFGGRGGPAARRQVLAAIARSARRSHHGLSAVIGSWNTMPMRLPRSRAIGLFGRRQGSPVEQHAARALPRCGSSPVIASAVSVLPEPLSPMMPKRSPAFERRSRCRSDRLVRRTHRKVSDLEQRLGWRLRLSRGSIASRSPSPSRLSPRR